MQLWFPSLLWLLEFGRSANVVLTSSLCISHVTDCRGLIYTNIQVASNGIKIKKTKLRGFSPQANYTDRALLMAWHIKFIQHASSHSQVEMLWKEGYIFPCKHSFYGYHKESKLNMNLKETGNNDVTRIALAEVNVWLWFYT
jgi:hypothetical protein